MNRLFFSIVFTAIICTLAEAEEVRLLDLEPNDAQNIIEQQDTSLKYAPKIESNVPALRYLGNEQHNVLEDIYLANQYHGQDGLGGYLYGYSVPDIAKTERKKAGGDLRGAYNYIAGNGQEIKVEYWDDGTGFHQIDNVPKALPEDLPEVKKAKEDHLRLWHELAERNSRPVESPYNSEGQYKDGPLSVQAQNQAKQQYYNQQPNQQGVYNQPAPNNQGGYSGTYQSQNQAGGQYQTNPYLQNTQYKPTQKTYNEQKPGYYNPQTGNQGSNVQYAGQSSENKNVYAQPGKYNPGQGQYGQNQGQYSQSQGQYNPSQGQHNANQGQYSQSQGQYNPSQGQHNANQGQYKQSQGQYQENEDGQYNPAQDKEGQYDESQDESTGPPKGFFYKFDYPVGIIVQSQGKAQNVPQQ